MHKHTEKVGYVKCIRSTGKCRSCLSLHVKDIAADGPLKDEYV